MAFVGGASSFIESSLAQLFKVRDTDGFRGGPAYYMQRGLKARWMGILFAVILIICFPFAFSLAAGEHDPGDGLGERRRRGARVAAVGHRHRASPRSRARRLRRACAASPRSPRRSCPPWRCSISSSASSSSRSTSTGCRPSSRRSSRRRSGYNEVVGATFGYIILTGRQARHVLQRGRAGLRPERRRERRGDASRQAGSRADPRRLLRHVPRVLDHGVHHPRLGARSRGRGRGASGSPRGRSEHARRVVEHPLSVIIFLLAFSLDPRQLLLRRVQHRVHHSAPLRARRRTACSSSPPCSRDRSSAPTSSGTSRTAPWASWRSSTSSRSPCSPASPSDCSRTTRAAPRGPGSRLHATLLPDVTGIEVLGGRAHRHRPASTCRRKRDRPGSTATI